MKSPGGVPNGLDGIAENEKQGRESDSSHETSIHSRLLTKKQLSDMAWGVRELSKKLGAIRLKLKVRTIFLLTKAHDEDLIEYTRGVAKWCLSKERDTKYIMYVCWTAVENWIADTIQLCGEDARA